MPRTAVLRTRQVEALLEYLESAPEQEYFAAVEAAEALIEEVDSRSSYPTEFVVWRLIGERVSEDSEAIDGSALRRELAVLIQRASEHRPLDAASEPGGALDLHEAAATIGISVRTLQRWRNDGLFLRQIRFPDGQVRLGVLQRTLKAFCTPDRMQRAAGFTRMSRSEADRLMERAQEFMAEGASLNEAALQVAKGSTRAHETIRQLIRRERGERGPVRGVGGRVRENERTFVLRAIDRGCSISHIAARIGRSPASTRRISSEARADRLRELRPSWIELPVFDQADAEHVLLEARDVTRRSVPMATASTLTELIQKLRHVSANPESLLLPAMHLQFRVAARRIDGLPRTPPVGRLDEIETGLRRGDQLRRRAGEAVLGAALGRVEQHLGHGMEELPPDLLAEWTQFCIEVVEQMLDSFDPTARGEIEPRLDRRVALETDKQIALRARRRKSREERVPRSNAYALDPCAQLEHLRTALGLAPRLIARFDRLSSLGRELLQAQYGLGEVQPSTLEELATRYESSVRTVTSELRRSKQKLQGLSD